MEQRARGRGSASRVGWQRVADGKRDLERREMGESIVSVIARQREKMQSSESYPTSARCAFQHGLLSKHPTAAAWTTPKWGLGSGGATAGRPRVPVLYLLTLRSPMMPKISHSATVSSPGAEFNPALRNDPATSRDAGSRRSIQCRNSRAVFFP